MVLTSLEIYEVDRYKRLLSTIFLERFPSRYRGLTESFPRRAGASYAQAPYTQVKTALDGKDINLAMIEVGLAEACRGPESGNPYKQQDQAVEGAARSAKKGCGLKATATKVPAPTASGWGSVKQAC
jgi:endonuclease YncB( thermonuclease family)